MRPSSLGRACAALLVFAAASNAQDTTMVSLSDAGVPGDQASGSEGVEVVVDAAGHLLVVFASYATNLVPGDTNNRKDLFLRDVTDGITTRLVMGLNGAEPDGDTIRPMMTADGRYVAFNSYSTNLVAGDTNIQPDIFVLDRSNGVIERVSLDVFGGECDGPSYYPSISLDGRYVAFSSDATDLVKSGVDNNGVTDVFLRDRTAAVTLCLSVNSSGRAGDGRSLAPPGGAISSDGGLVCFSSDATDLVKSDLNGVGDAFVRDVKGSTTRVSVDAAGAELTFESWAAALSPKGSIALFVSNDGYVLPGFSNGLHQAYARVLATGELLPAVARYDGSPLQTDYVYLECTIAGDDGSDFDPLVAFITDEDEILPGDGDAAHDVYVRRLRGGETQQVSVGSDGSPSYYSWVFSPSVTPDGRYVAFMTPDAFAYPLDTGHEYDVYVRGLVWTLFTEFGVGLAGGRGYVPHLFGRGGSCETAGHSIHLDDGLGGAFGLLWIGLATKDQNLFGGHFYVDFASFFMALPIVLGGAGGVAGDGAFDLDGINTESMIPLSIYLQCTLVDPAAVKKISLSNALEVAFEDEPQ